ncbi:MAG: phosphoethanolamine transferase domain-containing protein, partial [Muribaculaceae bacterium]|nr:phosphoethanolamine transferase domain-containing protein [Muribaculaceae bacterium]
MKLSEKTSLRISKILVWLVPAILMVPNVALSIQGHMGLLASFANFLLPAGVFLFMMTWRNRVGTNVLLLVPFMVLAAFQIVLLFLYADGSIIGVDMFLNVATSNPSEAMELLDNLRPAIITVVALYLPAIMLAIVAMRGKVRTGAVTA